jgi:hypothetical protein
LLKDRQDHGLHALQRARQRLITVGVGAGAEIHVKSNHRHAGSAEAIEEFGMVTPRPRPGV